MRSFSLNLLGNYSLPQSSKILWWCVPLRAIFIHCGRYLMDPFNLETCVLQAWGISLNYTFFWFFFPLISIFSHSATPIIWILDFLDRSLIFLVLCLLFSTFLPFHSIFCDISWTLHFNPSYWAFPIWQIFNFQKLFIVLLMFLFYSKLFLFHGLVTSLVSLRTLIL